MQAIVTKFIAPSSIKGSRIKATCQAGSITLPWDHAQGPRGNHTAAALALATRYGWNYGEWISAELPDSSLVWVCNTEYNDMRLTVEA
jgi:hypothetical protein